eukprot:9041011-Karenia_brevis.AAC.1
MAKGLPGDPWPPPTSKVTFRGTHEAKRPKGSFLGTEGDMHSGGQHHRRRPHCTADVEEDKDGAMQKRRS